MHTQCTLFRVLLPAFAVVLMIGVHVRPAAAQARIGVFDSRALALARFHCPDFENPAKMLQAEMKKAQEEGNEEQIARLRRLGPMHQAHLHDLVFGSGSVNAYFAELRARLSAIATEEGLDMIVSKWESAWIAENAVVIDVTEKLLEVYHPDANVRKALEEMKNVEPVENALFLED